MTSLGFDNIADTPCASAAQVVLYTAQCLDLHLPPLLHLLEDHLTTPAQLSTLRRAYTTRHNSPIVFPTVAAEVNFTMLLGLLQFHLGYHHLGAEQDTTTTTTTSTNTGGALSPQPAVDTAVLYGVVSLYFSHDVLDVTTLSRVSLEECSELFQLPLDTEYELAPAMYGYKRAGTREMCEKLHNALQNVCEKLSYHKCKDFSEYLIKITTTQPEAYPVPEGILQQIAAVGEKKIGAAAAAPAGAAAVTSMYNLLCHLIHDFISFNDQITLTQLAALFSKGEEGEGGVGATGAGAVVGKIHLHYYSKALHLCTELWSKFSQLPTTLPHAKAAVGGVGDDEEEEEEEEVVDEERKEEEEKYQKMLDFPDAPYLTTIPLATYAPFILYTNYLIDPTTLPEEKRGVVMCLPKDEEGQEVVEKEQNEQQQKTRNNNTATQALRMHPPVITLRPGPHNPLTPHSTLTTHVGRSYTLVATKLLLSLHHHNRLHPQAAITTQTANTITTAELLAVYGIGSTEPVAEQGASEEDPNFDTSLTSLTFPQLLPYLIQELITTDVEMWEETTGAELEMEKPHVLPPALVAFAQHFLFTNHLLAAGSDEALTTPMFQYWCDVIVRENRALFSTASSPAEPNAVGSADVDDKLIYLVVNREANPGYW